MTSDRPAKSDEPCASSGEEMSDSPPNRFEVDLDAIGHNLHALRAVLSRETKVYAAVKANGYGFGLLPVAHTLEDAGVDAVALANVRDAARLRRDGVRCPILLYGGNVLDRQVINVVNECGLIVTVGDRDSVSALSEYGAETTGVFVEIDVGLERLGVPVRSAVELIKEVADSPRLCLDGVYTHMHVSPGQELGPYVEWQFRRFTEVLARAHREGISTGIAMAASTPVLFLTSSMNLDAVDVGRYLYGIVRPQVEPGLDDLGLRPAFRSLRSRITHCKRVERDSFLDEARFALAPDMRIGVIPFGFADGLALLNCGEALVRGTRVPIVGGLSLEHVCVDLTKVPDVAVGDEVVFIGRQGESEISQEEVFVRQGKELPPGKLAVAVRETVARVYWRDGLPWSPSDQSCSSG